MKFTKKWVLITVSLIGNVLHGAQVESLTDIANLIDLEFIALCYSPEDNVQRAVELEAQGANIFSSISDIPKLKVIKNVPLEQRETASVIAPIEKIQQEVNCNFPFVVACSHGNVRIAKFILQKAKKRNIQLLQDSQQPLLLQYALLYQKPELIKVLVKAGANMTTQPFPEFLSDFEPESLPGWADFAQDLENQELWSSQVNLIRHGTTIVPTIVQCLPQNHDVKNAKLITELIRRIATTQRLLQEREQKK